LHAGIDRGVRADDCRPVHPGPVSHFGAGADQRRAVDSRAGEDLGVRVDPRRLTNPFAWKLHLDAALEAVEVGLHVRGVAAHILPVAVGDRAKDGLAFFQQLRKYVPRPVGEPAPKSLRLDAPRDCIVATMSRRWWRGRWGRMCSMLGRPAAGTRGLGMVLVSGRRRDPSPPAMTTALISPTLDDLKSVIEDLT